MKKKNKKTEDPQPDSDWDEFEVSKDGAETEMEMDQEGEPAQSLEEHSMDADEDGTDWDEKEDRAVEPAIEVDPEDPVVFPDQFYEVQTAYEQDGEPVLAGATVPIKCGNCAAWDVPLKVRGNKPLCRPGLPFLLPPQEGEESRKKWRMQEDRYSCQTHFIPRDMEDVLQHLTDDLDQARMLLWSFPTITRFVQLQQRIRLHHKKHGGDADKSINTMIDFMVLFCSTQQQQLVKPFVKRVVEGLVATRKIKKKQNKTAFQVGDMVSWEVRPGAYVEGFIQSIGGRNKLVTIIVAAPYVKVLCPDADQGAVQWVRPTAEWKEMDPKVLPAIPIVDQ